MGGAIGGELTESELNQIEGDDKKQKKERSEGSSAQKEKITYECVPGKVDRVNQETTNEVGENLKKTSRFGLTVLENIRDFIPDDITREEMKEMIVNAFGDAIVKEKSKYIANQTVTEEQVEGVVDYMLKIVQEGECLETQHMSDDGDRRLRDLSLKIGFYDLNKETARKKIFRNQKPTDEEIDAKIKELKGDMPNVKILCIEFDE